MDTEPKQCDECDGAGGECSLCGEHPDNCDCPGDCERDHWRECQACRGSGEDQEDEDQDQDEDPRPAQVLRDMANEDQDDEDA